MQGRGSFTLRLVMIGWRVAAQPRSGLMDFWHVYPGWLAARDPGLEVAIPLGLGGRIAGKFPVNEKNEVYYRLARSPPFSMNLGDRVHTETRRRKRNFVRIYGMNGIIREPMFAGDDSEFSLKKVNGLPADCRKYDNLIN